MAIQVHNTSGGIPSSFLRLVQGNRIQRFLRLTMDEGVPFQYGKDYFSVMVPDRGFLVLDPESGKYKKPKTSNKGIAQVGDYIKIVPACTIFPVGPYLTQVEANPELSEYGIVQGSYYIDHECKTSFNPCIHMEVKKELDLSQLDYVVKIRMRV